MKNEEIISMLVLDRMGVLQRVAGVFTKRGFNLDTITVGKTTKEGITRMSFTMKGEKKIAQKVVSQLSKLVEVMEVKELQKGRCVLLETILATFSDGNEGEKKHAVELAKKYDAKIFSSSPFVLVLTASPETVDAFVEEFKLLEDSEIVRGGTMVLEKK